MDCGDEWYGELSWFADDVVVVAAVVVDSLAVVDFVAFANSPDLYYDSHEVEDVRRHQPTVVDCIHFENIDYLVDRVNSKKISTKHTIFIHSYRIYEQKQTDN